MTIIFNNCLGQNKINTVIKLVAYLTEMGYFVEVNLNFLIVGHMKNSADHHCNCLKLSYIVATFLQWMRCWQGWASKIRLL